MPPISKVDEHDGLLTTTIPAEVARVLGLHPGDELRWTDDGAGGYRVMPQIREQEFLQAHEEIIREYGAVFDKLAKS